MGRAHGACLGLRSPRQPQRLLLALGEGQAKSDQKDLMGGATWQGNAEPVILLCIGFFICGMEMFIMTSGG